MSAGECMQADGPTGSYEPISRIGQHLLVDQEVLGRIIELVPPQAECVEIGPGFGALTEKLLENDDTVTAYEIDERCKPALEALSDRGDLTIHWQNFLEVPNRKIGRGDEFHIIGNIPFHISEPLIAKLTDLPFESAVLLVGERLAQSLTTQDPTHSDWSRVSMLSQAYFDTEYVMPVARDSFVPPPRVDGAVIRQVRKEAGQTNWQSDPLVMSYRAIADANAENSTIAKALKGILIDGRGRIQDGGDGDHVSSNRRQRRTGRLALREYANQVNFGGNIGSGKQELAPVPQTMYAIVQRSVDQDVLSKPLSGVNNHELRSVCAAISSAVNRRRKTR